MTDKSTSKNKYCVNGVSTQEGLFQKSQEDVGQAINLCSPAGAVECANCISTEK